MQNHNDNYISDLVKGTINILIDDLKNKTEPEISCEITCTLTCSGDYFDSDNFKRKRQIDKDYEEGIITKEEKAKNYQILQQKIISLLISYTLNIQI